MTDTRRELLMEGCPNPYIEPTIAEQWMVRAFDALSAQDATTTTEQKCPWTGRACDLPTGCKLRGKCRLNGERLDALSDQPAADDTCKRCNGRHWIHRPFPDDPYFEYGCPDCNASGDLDPPSDDQPAAVGRIAESVQFLRDAYDEAHPDAAVGQDNNDAGASADVPASGTRKQEPDKPPASPSPQPVYARDACDEIRAERRRQIDKEGWTLAHDDTHDQGSLPAAAASYALCAAAGAAHPNTGWNREYLEAARRVFPFDQEDWFKPKDARRDLIRAGALIVAEIERLDRAAIRNADREGKT